jgi:hypothetical protein
MASQPELSAANKAQMALIVAEYGVESVAGFGTTPPEELYQQVVPVPTAVTEFGEVAEKIKVDAIFGDQDVLLRCGKAIRTVGYVSVRATRVDMDYDELAAMRRGVTLALLEQPEKEFIYPELIEIATSLGSTSPGAQINRLLRNWWGHNLIINAHALIVPYDRKRKVNPLLDISFKSVDGPPESAE